LPVIKNAAYPVVDTTKLRLLKTPKDGSTNQGVEEYKRIGYLKSKSPPHGSIN